MTNLEDFTVALTAADNAVKIAEKHQESRMITQDPIVTATFSKTLDAIRYLADCMEIVKQSLIPANEASKIANENDFEDSYSYIEAPATDVSVLDNLNMEGDPLDIDDHELDLNKYEPILSQGGQPINREDTSGRGVPSDTRKTDGEALFGTSGVTSERELSEELNNPKPSLLSNKRLSNDDDEEQVGHRPIRRR